MIRRLTPAQADELRAEEERRLAPDEFERRASTPMTAQEHDDFVALVTWFRKRYPTAGDRMRAIRRRVRALRARQSG